MKLPLLRVARATNDLDKVLRFYRDGLGLDVLGEFHDHQGFDGIMLGSVGAPYHLEFTRERGHSVAGAPTKENLIVFYIPDQTEWNAAVARMAAAGFVPCKSHNPYWDRGGTTYEDFEGYRVVLYHGTWP